MNAPELPKLPPDAVAVAKLWLSEIRPSPSNPRKHIDAAYLADMAESIKSHGVIQPITVRPNPDRKTRGGYPYEIVVGECRWRAAKLAGLTDIPAFWRELDDKQVLEIQVIENLQRRDVHPLEEAEGYERLMHQHGYRAEDIAAKIGKSRAYVYARLKLTDLCAAARDAFYAGKLDASTALLVARIPGEALQKKAAKEITEAYNDQPLSYRAAKQHILARYTLNLLAATFKPGDATLLPAAGACTDCPKRSGANPDLFGDIDSADICTDPDCYEEKRQARRAQLIAHAEAVKIPVLTGDEARTAWHDDKYVDLDDQVPDDAQDRTYREILGNQAHVMALIEQPYGKNDLVECGEETALARALEKAGWKPMDEDGQPPAGQTPEEQAAEREQRLAAIAKREADDLHAQTRCGAENAWRRRLADVAWPALEAVELDVSDQADILIRALAGSWMRQQPNYSGMPEDLVKRFLGIELPEEFDEDVELEKILQTMQTVGLGTLLAMMLHDMSGEWELLRWHQCRDDATLPPPHTLLAIARALNIDAEALRDPVEPKPKAAKAKKTKSVPVVTMPAEIVQPWPFPVQAAV